jgi:hypothetical protein
MSSIKHSTLTLLSILLVLTILSSCRKLVRDDYQDPELESLSEGIKSCVAVGYCASIAYTFFNNEQLPDNVAVVSQDVMDGTKEVLLTVLINEAYPLPLNTSVGQITIVGQWTEDQTPDGRGAGVITAVFTDFNILESKYDFIGYRTIPIEEQEDGKIRSMFAQQDIMIKETDGTTPDLEIETGLINIEVKRLDEKDPDKDAFGLMGQNAWFFEVDCGNTASNIYDDEYRIDGGGQIIGASSASAGFLFHALLNATFNHSVCPSNPVSGEGFTQNLRSDSDGDEDLGHVFLNFRNKCDGKAHVKVATGKYILSIGKDIDLNLN